MVPSDRLNRTDSMLSIGALQFNILHEFENILQNIGNTFTNSWQDKVSEGRKTCIGTQVFPG